MICTHCHKHKELSQFSVSAKRSGGGWCKPCRKAKSARVLAGRPKRTKSRKGRAKSREGELLEHWHKVGYGSIDRAGKSNVHGFRK